jgi:HPt (histidine-containing phosphotransfer) domain-containing protein
MMDTDAPIYDEGVVAELRAATGDDDDFILDLVATYLAEGDEQLATITAAAEAADAAAMVPAAHTLKSSSAALGAMRLAAVCRGLEDAARAGRTDGFAAAAQRARDAWTDTIAAFRAGGLTT